MPSELRHIIFRAVEVLGAVKEYRRRMQLPLISGSIIRFSIEDTPHHRAELVVMPDSGPPEVVTVFENEVLAAALILFCRDRKIPLPADGEKSLQKIGSNLAMIVSRNPKGEDLPEIARI